MARALLFLVAKFLERGHERRRSQRVGVTGKVRLPDESVGGFLLDASDDGVRAVLWTHDVRTESVVALALIYRGVPHVRHAMVRWVRAYREGSVVGLELLPEDMPGDITAIEPYPLVPVGDPRTRDVIVRAFVRVGDAGSS